MQKTDREINTAEPSLLALRGMVVAAPVAISVIVLLLSVLGYIPAEIAESMTSKIVVLLCGLLISAMASVAFLAIEYRRKAVAMESLMRSNAENQQRARENERHQRVLFEDAMQTAYTDLDRLNQSLREQKDYLEARMEEQSRTAKELRQSEERWRQLVERNPEGIIITRGRRILYGNGVAVSLVSDDPEDLIGQSVLKFLPREVWSEVERLIKDRSAGIDADVVQLPVRALDGTHRWIEAYSVPIKYRNQSAVQTVIRDVTARRQAQVELLKYTDRIAALHLIAQGILSDETAHVVAENALSHLNRLVPMDYASVLDINLLKGEGRLLVASDDKSLRLMETEVGAIKTFGCAAPDARTPDYLYHPGMDEATVNMSVLKTRMFVAGVRSYIELPLVVKNEWLGMIHIGRNREDGFTEDDCNVAVDIVKMIAVSMHQERIEVERLGYETELLAAKDHAEQMARLKTTFLTNMSHEIRTPLTGIIGFAQILSEEIGDEHSEFVNLIEQSGRRLLDTINSVLDLARLESNRMRMSLEPIAVDEAVEHGARLLKPLADKKQLHLNVSAEDRVVCRLDRTGLDRILNNLVGNAIKFTEKGGVTVSVRRDGADCLIEVSDTGVGISSSFLPHLFDEFRQESSGADRSHEGSGMGLAITRKLVEIMKGEISVESEKGRGTTFSVRFPIRQQAAPDSPPVARQLHGRAAQTRQARRSA